MPRACVGGLVVAALVSIGPGAHVAAADRDPAEHRERDYAGPIIDVHVHAFEWDRYGAPPPPNTVTGRAPEARSDAEAARSSLARMERLGVVRAVASGPARLVAQWRARDPDRIVPGLYAETPDALPPPEALRERAEAGRLEVLGELAPQYAGGTLADPGWQPYLELAEELALPVAVHTGMGPPRAPYTCCPAFRSALGRPSHLEEVLVRHPELRIMLAHAGLPWLEETLALLHVHPRVYVDVGVIDWAIPRAQFHAHLKALVEAGFEDRILFGSDDMIWPDAFALAIEGVDSAPFLSAAQKRKIFHDNAARFLGLGGPE